MEERGPASTVKRTSVVRERRKLQRQSRVTSPKVGAWTLGHGRFLEDGGGARPNGLVLGANGAVTSLNEPVFALNRASLLRNRCCFYLFLAKKRAQRVIPSEARGTRAERGTRFLGFRASLRLATHVRTFLEDCATDSLVTRFSTFCENQATRKPIRPNRKTPPKASHTLVDTRAPPFEQHCSYE